MRFLPPEWFPPLILICILPALIGAALTRYDTRKR